LGSLAYWLLVHVCAALTPLEGRALIISLFIMHGLLVDLFGWHFDFTFPPAYLAHAAANVPMPGRAGKAATAPRPLRPAASVADSSRRPARSGDKKTR
jgi:hypothetical protein